MPTLSIAPLAILVGLSLAAASRKERHLVGREFCYMYSDSLAGDSCLPESQQSDLRRVSDKANRAAEIVAQMTLEEKVSQLMHQAPAIPRLGIPAYVWWNECLHGVARAGQATVFPQATGLAATWDPTLLERVGDAISTEGRAKHHDAVGRNSRGMYFGLTFWSPNINLFRDPRWGRGQETYGEDPFLVGKLGAAFVRGIQGSDPERPKAVATPKHFAVHSGPEVDRHRFDARPTEQDFWDSYLPHFETAVREGGAMSVMGAYNRVYGTPCCASTQLLDDILRRRWGFRGYVVSDCWAVSDMVGDHKVFPTMTEAAAASLKAGCDLECGPDYRHLAEAVQRGLCTEGDVDRALTRVMEARIRLGLLDPPRDVPPMSVVNGPAHRDLALQSARESLVLLKNNGLLPLTAAKLKRLAVVGPNADTVTAFMGNYAGEPKQAPTILEALRARLPHTEIVHVKGVPHTASADPLSPVPDVLLESEGRPGLRAEYFSEPFLEGAPAVVRQEAGIDFSDIQACHVPGLPLSRGAARWSGVFVAPDTGRIRLGVRSKEKVRLWIDGRLAVDAWEGKGTTGAEPLPTEGFKEGTALTGGLVALDLQAGQRVSIRVEYAHAKAPSLCQLLWDQKAFDPTPLVLARVKDADAVVFVGGLHGDLEGEEGEFRTPLEGMSTSGDRLTIELPRVQHELVQALHAVGKPVVLVNMSGSAMAMPWEAEHLPAILQAWYPGEAGGEALARVLLGEDEPGGRLPLTFYRTTADLPAFDDYRMAGRTYRFFEGRPLWSFGHGLGYTTFRFEALRLPKRVPATGTVEVAFAVRNTGRRAGEAVPQVYVSQVKAPVGRPLQDLRAFERVHLKPGERRVVRLRIPASTLRRWDVAEKDYVVDPGAYDIHVGTSAADSRLSGRITVTSEGSR